MGIPLFWRPATGGQQALLEGAAACTAAAVGALTTSIALAGATSGSATAAGAFTTQILLSGTALASATAAAELTTVTPILLEGAAQATATAAGELAAEAVPADQPPVVAGGGGGIVTDKIGLRDVLLRLKRSLQTPALLEVSARCTAQATGELTSAILLSADPAVIEAAISGALSTDIELAAAARCSCLVAGTVSDSDIFDEYTDDEIVEMLMMDMAEA